VELSRSCGLRARARRAVRAEIAEVAFALFVERGFDQTTVEDIAAAAGLSRRSFFRYFPTKEDTVLGFLYEVGERLAEAVSARPAAEDAWTALRAGFDVVIEGFLARPKEAVALLRLIHGTPALRARHQDKQEHWRRLLTEAVRPRTSTALAADLLVTSALGAFDVACRHWLSGEARLPGELLDEVFALVGPRRAG
jgi:AcrR family transcriptional regulator